MRWICDAWEAPPLGQLPVGPHWCAFQFSFFFLANILSLLMLTSWPPSHSPSEVLPLSPLAHVVGPLRRSTAEPARMTS